jgi:hypothetical protein
LAILIEPPFVNYFWLNETSQRAHIARQTTGFLDRQSDAAHSGPLGLLPVGSANWKFLPEVFLLPSQSPLKD